MKPTYTAKAFIHAQYNGNDHYMENYFYTFSDAKDFVNDLGTSGWIICNADIKKLDTSS
jgi:hypothetical protein